MKNRNELSKLYTDAKKKSEKVNISNSSMQTPITDVKLKIWQVLSVATLLFIPVDILVLLVNYSKNSDWIIFNQGTIAGNMGIPVILLIGVLIITIAKISNILCETNIDNRFFLIVFYMWLLPISQLIYNLYLHLNGNVVYPMIYALILFSTTLVIVFIIMYLMNNKIRTSKAQNKLLVFSVLLCAFVTIINSFLN